MTPIERAAPGTVLPNGSIKLDKPSPIYGGCIPAGRVFIDRSQIAAAVAAGWNVSDRDPKSQLVVAER